MKENLEDLYNQGFTLEQIGYLFGRHKSYIQRLFKYFGVNTRDRGSERKYIINDTYFDNIDTEEKAYFLGFLYADGSNDGYRTYLKLKEEDKEILEKLQILIKSENPIKKVVEQYKNQDYISYKLVLNSKKLCESLEKVGCVKNKTFKLTYPHFINKDLQRHFIRGYFDGDGCISYSSNFRSVVIAGNKTFVEDLQKILIHDLNLSKTKIRIQENNFSRLEYSGWRNCFKLRDYLYIDSTIYLDRKFQKFKNLNQIKT